jgi:hypothetical protein
VLRLSSVARAALLSTLAAYGCADRDVAATPSALIHRDGVPLGAPVEITFRFQMSHHAPPLAANHRVLVRTLFDDGKVLASYDHDPPTPTDQWHPGRTVTYTRRIFAPDLPYVGEVPVVVGLVSPSGERLRLEGKDVGDRLYEVATMKLHAHRTLVVPVDGWHRLEGPPMQSGGYRWTYGKATMTFRNPRQDAVLHLRLSAMADVFPTPQEASVLIGDTLAQRVPVTPTETDFAVALPAAAFGDGDDVVMAIEVDRTFVPSKVQKGRDHRELGVRVHNVFLEPRTR